VFTLELPFLERMWRKRGAILYAEFGTPIFWAA